MGAISVLPVAVVLAVSALVGLISVVYLGRGRRYMHAALVLLSWSLLLAFVVPCLYQDDALQEKSPNGFVYSLAFLALFGTLYPAIPTEERQERARMYFLTGLVGVAVFLSATLLSSYGFPAPYIVLGVFLGCMLTYTVGTIATAHRKTRRWRRMWGTSYAVWGAVSVSHLLYYPALAILYFAPLYCGRATALGILLSVAFALAAMASCGIRSEGDYWMVVAKKPLSLFDSQAYFFPAMVRSKRRQRRLA